MPGNEQDPGITRKIHRPSECAELEQKLLSLVAPEDIPDIRAALTLMYRAHNGQFREGGLPYATHPLSVALLAAEEVGVKQRDPLIAALLHDVLEDAPDIQVEEIADRFGPDVAKAVVALTKMYKREGTPREEGLRRYYAALVASPEWVRAIKLCDRVHNLRSLAASGRSTARMSAYHKESREHLLPLAEGATDPALQTAAGLLRRELFPEQHPS